MKKLKMILTLMVMLISLNVSAQLPGYKPYQVVAIIKDGVRNEGCGTYYLKFEGNFIFMDMFGNGSYVNRYIHSGEYSDGNAVYYHQSYNYGTMTQGSGYITDRTCWLLVSPDQKHINQVANNWGKTITILELQTASSAGSMVY